MYMIYCLNSLNGQMTLIIRDIYYRHLDLWISKFIASNSVQRENEH